MLTWKQKGGILEQGAKLIDGSENELELDVDVDA